MVLMQYLLGRMENRQPACSPHHLATRVHELNTQRQERIQRLLDLLEASGLVRATIGEHARLYEITEKGALWYRDAARKVVEVFGALYR
jgi:DNA-binding PadR family transcriptional regulator